MEGVTSTQWSAMPLAERLDRCAIDIMLHGLRRPAVVYIWHFTLLLINYGCFALTLLAVGPSTHKQPLLHGFVKLIVWQHFAESLGCRQGPIYGHLGPPCNLMYRLSLGTVKLAKVAVLGTRRTAVDLLSHLLFYVGIFAFLASREYRTEALWLICGCDAFHFLSDSTQFYAANGHTYYSVLLSACFPAERGRLAGMQTALLLQWFFSGVGKIGPWFEYVNGPFMLQSMLLAPARRWLAGLLVRSPFHLSPTRFGQAVAHAAAAVEYLAPLALLLPSDGAVAFGMASLGAMHAYILAMPAPFDVYSWNLCFGLCVPLLFWRIETLGFDWAGLSQASPLLLVYLGAECLTCAAGNVLPDRLGYYISHRYWAGNWCMMLFYIRDTDAARAKLDAVKAFSPNPLRPPKLGLDPFLMDVALHKSLAYLWLGNLNTKCLVPLIEEACAAAGGAPSDFKAVPSLPLYFAGEFRDFLFGVELMGEMQAVAGFDAGECFAVKMSAFSMLGEGNRSEVHDLKKGRVRSYATSRAGLRAMDALPSSAPTFKKAV